jgi:ligand-binding sensor domain-containing protein
VGEGGWSVWQNSRDDYYDYLGEQNGNLVVCGVQRIRVYGPGGQQIREVSCYYAKHALLDSENTLWYAHPDKGLIRMTGSDQEEVICPDGPAYRSAGDMEVKSGKLWVGGGTDATKWSGFGAYAFIDEDWQSFNYQTIPELSGFLNISEITIDPGDDDHVIGGSNGYGIAEFNDGTLIGITDETNSILKPVAGFGHGYVMVTGTDLDTEGNLWVSTNFSDQPVYRRNSNGEWEFVELDYPNFGIDTRIGDILATSAGQVWLLIQNSGILVFSSDREVQVLERFFTVENQIPDLLDRVYSIAEEGSCCVF